MAVYINNAIGFPKNLCDPTATTFLTQAQGSFDPVKSEEVLKSYPIQRTEYSVFDGSGAKSIDDRIYEELIDISTEEIDTSSKKPYIVLSNFPTRKMREKDGHIYDPWNRSIHTYSSKFRIQQERRQTKVLSDSCEEIIMWIVKTTVDKVPVIILLWENIKLRYVRKSQEVKFLMSISPKEIKLDTDYEL